MVGDRLLGDRRWRPAWAGVRRNNAMCAATKVFGAVGFVRLIAFGAWRVRPETKVRAKTNPEEVKPTTTRGANPV
jgi:hypothetical protein